MVPRAHPVGMYRPNPLRLHRRSPRYGHVTSRHAAPALALRGNRYFLHRKYDHPLYGTFTWFVKRAVKMSELSDEDKRAALKASLHWLRHTHATRFAERGGDLDVLQANLGHSDPRTSARYFRAQIERRQEQVELAFGVMPVRRPSKPAAT